MIGTQPQRLLKIWNGFGGAPFARGQQSEIVPCVGVGVGIAGLKFGRALKALARFADLLPCFR